MSRHYFGGTDNAELRAKTDEAKDRLPMPECGEGDEIDSLAKAKGIDVKEATTRRAGQLIDRYLMMPNKRFSRVFGRDKRIFWIQTTSKVFARKLRRRQDTRHIDVIGWNHFRQTFEMCGNWRKIKRIINRYILSTGDVILPVNRPSQWSDNLSKAKAAADAYTVESATGDCNWHISGGALQ
jgi:hypothetical protein